MECQLYPSPRSCQEDDAKSNVFAAETAGPVPRKPQDERPTQFGQLSSPLSRPGFSPKDRRLLLAAQFRLLAARLDRELPVDFRSIKNMLRLCSELIWEQAA